MAISSNQQNFLAVQARDIFTTQAAQQLPELAKAVLDKFAALMNQPGSTPEMQARRDAWMSFQKCGKAWVTGTHRAWRSPLSKSGQLSAAVASVGVASFELLDNEVMEGKILASRLALRMADVVAWELNDLRLRVQNLEQSSELGAGDILRPEAQARWMVEQWTAAGLSRESWVFVQDVIQARMAEYALEAYHAANEFLVQNGVMVEIDLRPLVKRTPSSSVNNEVVTRQATGESRTADGMQSTGNREARGRAGAGGPVSGRSGSWGGEGSTGGESSAGDESRKSAGRSTVAFGQPQTTRQFGQQALQGSRGAGSMGSDVRGNGGAGGAGSTGGTSNTSNTGGQGDGPRHSGSSHDETRMQTATSPLARAKMRAQGVMGTLKRLLSNQVAGFDDTRSSQASPQLALALASHQGSHALGANTAVAIEPAGGYNTEHVVQMSSELRQRTTALKKTASTSTEKATIEIVALMFQAILAEDRIPPAIRVWFARLQMPVLRVAITEPEFFGTLEHPARRLIDRMGSCVLGFDVAVAGGAMEIEIKRIVQVIEQYPETGRRVFQLVFDEFQKFLSRFLSENGSAARVVSIAQQVEQKETMAIQYTIEMRKMLNDMPVRDEIREFLFKVWAEVLALAAMRSGAQHEQTIMLKQAASSLVWAASAKPNRADRAKVIADLPRLLQLLRMGMTMLAMDSAAQEKQLKIISDILADAFMSKTDAISGERIDAMAKRLENLEDYLSDEDVGDLPLDTEALVMMIGIDASDIEVVTDGGSQPSQAMRSWAQELQLGSWFSLDHNGRVNNVQFAWRSDRKQLHLFASNDGRSFLIQARRLAAYLQAGLLLPTEEEALTVRATRDALAKLEANPERLLG